MSISLLGLTQDVFGKRRNISGPFGGCLENYAHCCIVVIPIDVKVALLAADTDSSLIADRSVGIEIESELEGADCL